MSTLRRKLARFSNWSCRNLGLPSQFVDHMPVSVTLSDDHYSVKTSIINLTGKDLEILPEAFVSDSGGLLSFENLSVLPLVSSEQLFRFNRLKRLSEFADTIRLLPHGIVDIELAQISKADGSISLFYKHGVAKLASSGCVLTVRITGGGFPHTFLVEFKNQQPSSDIFAVKQHRSLNHGPQVLSLDLDPGSVDSPENVPGVITG